MQQQVGADRLLERRAEGVDELVGELADEADRVGQQVRTAPEADRAGGRVERVEEAVAHLDLGARIGAGAAAVGRRERVEQRRLARVGVARECDRGQRGALALGAHRGARAAHVLQAPAQRRDPVAREAAVGLDLGLARPSRADPAAEALEVGPQAAHPREVVLQLRQLDLELALRGGGVRGEDVEDHRGAVDHCQPELLLEVALLTRAELVVAGDHVRVALLRGALGLCELARPEVAVGVRLLAALHQLPHDSRPRRCATAP